MRFMCVVLVLFLFFLMINSETVLNESVKSKELFQNKIKSEAIAVEEEKETPNFFYYSKLYMRKLFSFESPLNKCHAENCEFCCLSLNYCGTKQQCENSYYTMNILKILFMTISSILVLFLIYKIYITDSEPEHQEEDKIDDHTLNLLIGLFIQNRDNRRKIKP
jgi:hypothetical protein